MFSNDHQINALNFIGIEAQKISKLEPRGYPVILFANGYNYTATAQHIAHHFDYKIVLVDKSTKPMKPEFYNALKAEQPTRVFMKYALPVKLEGRMHVLALEGCLLKLLNEEQSKYIISNMRIISSTNSGDKVRVYTQGNLENLIKNL